MVSYSKASKGSPNPRIRNAYVYIDNSNLWIQGQRTWASRHGLRTDPVWRFDAGKVISLIESHLEPVEDDEEVRTQVNLYGSSPPPVDTVWRAIAAKNVSVSTFARSALTGKDTRAVRDMMLGESSEFVIISGDSDLYPAAAAIAECGFVVHIWSWDNALASIYRRILAEEPHGLIRVHLLDPFLDQIGFRATSFDTSRAHISLHSIVVLDPLSHADAIDAFLSGLDEPVYRYQFEPRRDDAASCDLVIIPAAARSMGHDELNNLFQSAVKALGKFGIKVVTYLEYQQRFTRPGQASQLILSERFSELPLNVAGPSSPVSPVLSHSSVDTERVRDDDMTNNFIEVNQRSERKRQRLQATQVKMTQRCDMRLYCDKELACPRGHTEEERSYFKTYCHKKATKYAMCREGNQCTRMRCTFAHSDAELLCPTCDKIGAGHNMWDCPQSMRNRKPARSL
ncbi:hypothetical protein F5X68DRAFT_161167 [Plectosphaerella plurivora]|uniref:NYN domain-containing protein n=1 Tax=Plectosphaerella plurivora TaxID=936078 RepID=A0A9P9A5C6_9PEZI|nr:hypothetical protein F5X68DRAFT_161167 [Plectosphaerella plurivora]